MKLRYKSLLAIVTCIVLCMMPAYVAGQDKDLSKTLLSEVNALRAEVETLRAKSDENWLNEKRSEEIRSLLHSVLADADTRASLLQDGVTAGWNNGFFMQSADGNNLMKVGGLLQFRWVGNFRGSEAGRASTSPTDDTETGFEFRRIELGFSGHVFSPRLTYNIVLATEDGGGDPPPGGVGGVEQIIAQDIVIGYKLKDDLTIQGGRYFAPFLREELIGGGGSLAIALSYMNNNLSIGRGEGVSLVYQTDTLRVNSFFSDGAGSGGGGGVNNPTADAVDYAITSRVDYKFCGEWSQWGDFTANSGDSKAVFLGAAVHYQGGEHGDALAGNNTDLFGWTVDGSVEFNNLNLFVAVAGNHFENSVTGDIDNYGFVIQGGYVTGKYEPFLRYELMSFDKALGYVDDDVSLITVGVNYHANANLELSFDVVYALDVMPTDSLNAGLLADGTKDGQVVIRAQAQLKF